MKTEWTCLPAIKQTRTGPIWTLLALATAAYTQPLLQPYHNGKHLYPAPAAGSALDPYVLPVSDASRLRWEPDGPQSSSLQFAAVCLQGLINRDRARLYLEWDQTDPYWLDSLPGAGYALKPHAIDFDFLRRNVGAGGVFAGSAKGLLLYDTAIFRRSSGSYAGAWRILVNVYGIMAAEEDLVPIPYQDRDKWDLPVKYDAGFGATRSPELWAESQDPDAAYRWVVTKYPTFSGPSPLALLHPGSLRMRDYLVAHRIHPLYYWEGMAAGTRQLFDSVLARTRPNQFMMGIWNIPEWGRGIDDPKGFDFHGPCCSEHDYLRLLSKFGKFMAVTGEEGISNLSWHSGLPQLVRDFRKSGGPGKPGESGRPVEILDRNKHYISLIVSDGDNLWYLWKHDMLASPRFLRNPAKVTAPLTWTLNPGMADLMPGILSWLYLRSDAKDIFASALNGPGYFLLDDYANLYGPDREPIIREYFRMAGDYLNRAGQKSIWMVDNYAYALPGRIDSATTLREWTWAAQELYRTNGTLSVAADYGARPAMRGPADFSQSVGNVPIFNAVDDDLPEVDSMAAEIRRNTPKDGQGFMHVFLINWNFRPDKVNALLAKLGDGYKAVDLETLGRLYREARGGAEEAIPEYVVRPDLYYADPGASLRPAKEKRSGGKGIHASGRPVDAKGRAMPHNHGTPSPQREKAFLSSIPYPP